MVAQTNGATGSQKNTQSRPVVESRCEPIRFPLVFNIAGREPTQVILLTTSTTLFNHMLQDR